MSLLRETSFIKSIALYVQPKNSKHLQSHSRAIMALDHSRLDLENKLLENKSGRIFFLRSTGLRKSCQQIWECVNQLFILFIHHIWGETVLFIIQTSDRMRYFTIFQDTLHLVNIQDDQSCTFSQCLLFSKMKSWKQENRSKFSFYSQIYN